MITKINHNSKGTTYSTIDIEEVVEMLRLGTFSDEVKEYRNTINIIMAANGMPLEEMPRPTKLPELCFAAVWRKKNGSVEMKEYNGLIMLETSNLPTADEARRLRKEASRIPYTRLAFVGITGRDVVIVCALTADDMEKRTAEQIKALHLSAYKHLHYLYSSQLLLSLDNKKPELDRTCCISCDSDT